MSNSTEGIPREKWRWRGMAGHLAVSTSCCFHMVTEIGRLRVSTIGCYHRSEIRNEARNYENRSPIGAGADSLYETYVFALDENDEVSSWEELDGERYATEEDAEVGHMRYCEKVAALNGNPRRLREATDD